MENEPPIDQFLLRIIEETSVFAKQELKEQLIFYINHLLINDFERLVQLLYRIDVDEENLKLQLSQSPQTDASVLIADLLISRQQQKQITWKQPPADPASEKEELW